MFLSFFYYRITYMEKIILNYRIIIEKETTGDRQTKVVYNAYCPTLELADFGETIDEIVQRMTKLIKFHVESLSKLHHKVPVEKETTTIITSVEVPVSSHTQFLYT